MTLSEFMALLESLGLRIVPADPGVPAPLYAHAGPAGAIQYAGVDQSRDGRRAAREEAWVACADPDRELAVGFVRMAHARRTSCTRLAVPGASIDPARALTLAEGWEGPAIDRYRAWVATRPVLTAQQLETLTVRTLVATGTPIANSAKAGMWESYAGNPIDTAAQLAVVAGRERA